VTKPLDTRARPGFDGPRFDGPRSGSTKIVLASASPARAALLAGAGVSFEQVVARVDEDALKAALKAEGAPVEDAAAALGELKALAVARKHPDALVIGADQILECDGVWFDKPADRAAAAATLRALAGRSHALVSGVCVVRGGARLWHHVDRAVLHVRTLDDAFIDHYLDAVGDDAMTSVGAYQLEGLGAHLFARVEGDFFTILGLPLLPLLDFLREHGVVPR